MKRILRDVRCVLLMSAMAAMLPGYFGILQFHWRVVSNAPKVRRDVSLGFERGRIDFWNTSMPMPTTWPTTGSSTWWSAEFPRWPDARRSVWEFDWHQLGLSRSGSRAFIIAFPIWCPEAVFAGLLFLRLHTLRRERGPAQGFEVMEDAR